MMLEDLSDSKPTQDYLANVECVSDTSNLGGPLKGRAIWQAAGLSHAHGWEK